MGNDTVVRSLFDGKVCIRCLEWKSFPEFFKCRRMVDGLGYYCKTCHSGMSKEYYENNKEKAAAATKRWHEANPDKVRAYKERNREKWNARAVEKRKANPEPRRQAALKYWRKNKDRCKESLKAWREANPEKWILQKERRRAVEVGAEGEYTVEEWKALCKRFENKCVRCKLELPLTVDHVVPLSKGGTNYIENIQPLCLACNSSKGTKCTDYREAFFN